jgi:ribosome-associated protein
MSRSLVINSQIVIHGSELIASFARSSGPGGQNVNKVNSKALVRWNLRASEALSAEVKLRFEACFPTRINQAGEVMLSSDKYRDQGRNLSDCYEKLRQLIQAALIVPRKRKKSRPTRSSIQERLTDKRQKSVQKTQRKFRPSDEN